MAFSHSAFAFKVERGWKNLPLYFDVNGKFSQDYHAIMDDGTDSAAINVFTRGDGVIRHFWGAETGNVPADPGGPLVRIPAAAPGWPGQTLAGPALTISKGGLY